MRLKSRVCPVAIFDSIFSLSFFLEKVSLIGEVDRCRENQKLFETQISRLQSTMSLHVRTRTALLMTIHTIYSYKTFEERISIAMDPRRPFVCGTRYLFVQGNRSRSTKRYQTRKSRLSMRETLRCYYYYDITD